MVDVRRSELTNLLGFTFQRLRYELVNAENVDKKKRWDDDDDEPDLIRRVCCPVDKPLSFYASAKGLNEETVEELTEQYGVNALTVQVPSFISLYKEQLL